MATRVSSASELLAALNSASGGDTILLEKGDYGRMSLRDLKFDKDVTIKSADGDGGARFQHITLRDSTHLKLDSLTVEFGRPSHHNDKAIDVMNSHHIKIVNSEIIGNTATKDWSDTAQGIQTWHQSSNIEISGNHFHHFARAGLFFGNDITIKDNLIDDIRLDGLFFGRSNNLLIENNVLTNFYRQGTDHADYIQFDPGTTGAARDVVIRGNVMLKGDGKGDVQGIFGANHHQSTHNTVFTNFLIEDNIYFDTGLNAIQFYTGENMVVRNNTVLMDPADGRVVWVRLSGKQNNSVIEDNVSTQINAEGGATASGNVTVQYKNPSGPNYYGDLFTDPFASPATLADLAPKPGTPISYGSGKGAENTFQELLGGGAADRKPVDSAPPPADKDPVDTKPADKDPVDTNPVDKEPADKDPVDTNPVDKEPVGGEPVDNEPAGGSPNSQIPVDSGTFNGKGSEVILAHQKAFELTDGVLELKFTPEAVEGRQVLFSKDAHGFEDGGHLTVTLVDGALVARMQSTKQSYIVQAENAVSAGDEHHAALSFGQNGLKLYVNGDLVDTNAYTGGLAGNDEPIVLGAGQSMSSKGLANNLDGFFTGAIAGVALYEDLGGSDADADFLLS
jgi:hypothetical protein